MLSTINELPDLPGIEEEESGHISSACCFGFIGIIILLILFGAFGNVEIGLYLITPIITITALIQWLLGSNIKTNADGLSYHRPYRDQTIKWTDIADARITTNKRCRNMVEIITNNRVVYLPINGDDHPRIIASIWQHLRRHDKAESFTLPDNVLSMWCKIPDDIPEEMDFTGKSQGKSNCRIVNRLRQDAISQEIIGASSKDFKQLFWDKNPRVLKWNEIVDADFTFRNNEDTLVLFYDDIDEGEVDIACLEYNDGTYDIDNARFLLALVRRAKQAIDKPIPIPEWLRKTCNIQLP